jgi:hypothetical protein
MSSAYGQLFLRKIADLETYFFMSKIMDLESYFFLSKIMDLESYFFLRNIMDLESYFFLRKITYVETYMKMYKYSVLEKCKFLALREKPTCVSKILIHIRPTMLCNRNSIIHIVLHNKRRRHLRYNLWCRCSGYPPVNLMFFAFNAY